MDSTTAPADVVAIFECPECSNYILPPILQCHKGHIICSDCRRKLIRCPECRASLVGNILNEAMEKIASIFMFPCKYSTSGCAVSLLHTERREHEESCDYRPYSCPYPGDSCKWEGSLEEVAPHLMKSHEVTLNEGDVVFSAIQINHPKRAAWLFMQSCFGHNFLFVAGNQENFGGHQQFFALVQLIGSRNQAENFKYTLELKGQRSRVAWEAPTRSIREGVSSVFTYSHCLVLNACTAQHFADKGELSFDVSISKV